MTKTYDLSGREKGPPKISKLDTINKQINKVIIQPQKKGSSSTLGELSLCSPGQGQGWPCHQERFWAQFCQPQPSSGYLPFKKCPPFASLQVEACFKKFDKDKDGMLNFVEFKNFMGKRKSLPDKVTFDRFLFQRKLFLLQALARCTSTLSLRSARQRSSPIYPYIPLSTSLSLFYIMII